MSAGSPHEAFFTPNGEKVWITRRGEHHVASRRQQLRGEDPHHPARRPGMQIFFPDIEYGRRYLVSLPGTPEQHDAPVQVAAH
jgi:hypothetical protein